MKVIKCMKTNLVSLIQRFFIMEVLITVVQL